MRDCVLTDERGQGTMSPGRSPQRRRSAEGSRGRNGRPGRSSRMRYGNTTARTFREPPIWAEVRLKLVQGRC